MILCDLSETFADFALILFLEEKYRMKLKEHDNGSKFS